MSDTAKIKKELEARLRELGIRVEEIEDDLRVPRSADSEDRATETENDEMLDSLEESAIKEIGAIQAALRRIDEGTYDVCAGCGKKIGAKRLAALPYAAVCIECAEAG